MPLAGPNAEVLTELGNTELVTRIIAADTEAMGEFHRRFIRGLQYWLRGQQGMNHADAEDLAQGTILIVIRQLQKSGLNDPKCLAGYVRTIALRQVLQKRMEDARYASIDSATAAEFTPDRRLNPEQMVLASERSALLRQALAHLKPIEVEILTRFYLQNQARKQIEAEMGLSETQFRLQKSRAKSRLEKEAKRIADAGAVASARRRLLDKRAA